jgi:hypothetical protein
VNPLPPVDRLKRIGIALDSCIYRQRVGLKEEMALPDCVRFPLDVFHIAGIYRGSHDLDLRLPACDDRIPDRLDSQILQSLAE